MVTLAERKGQTPDELVEELAIVIQRGDPEAWAAEAGITTNGTPTARALWHEPVLEAIRAAFTPASLGRVLWVKLDVRLEDVTQPGTFPDTIVELLQWATRCNRLGELLRAALEANPGNMELKRVSEDYRELFR